MRFSLLRPTARQPQLSKYLSIEVMVTTGGTSLKDDIMRLYQTTHIVVATPGRVVDLASKGVARLNECRMLVMDEVRRRSRHVGPGSNGGEIRMEP